MPLGIVATAVGAVGLGVGTAFGFLAKSEFDTSNQANCDKSTNICHNQAGLDQRSDAVNKGNIGTGVFIAGAVVAATGIVVWITAPSSHATKAGAAPRPAIGLGPTGVSLRGAW